MPEQNTDEQKKEQSLVDALRNGIGAVTTKNTNEFFQHEQKDIRNSMDGLGMEETKSRGDLRRDI